MDQKAQFHRKLPRMSITEVCGTGVETWYAITNPRRESSFEQSQQ